MLRTPDPSGWPCSAPNRTPGNSAHVADHAGLVQARVNGADAGRADARKINFATKASGVVQALGGAPVKATVTLDPLLFNAGIGYRF